jgi:hypothetical protein
MKRTDEELIEVLESMGVPWGRHFVLNDALVCYYDESGRLFAHVIEDDELARLVRKFLVKNGKVMKEEER